MELDPKALDNVSNTVITEFVDLGYSERKNMARNIIFSYLNQLPEDRGVAFNFGDETTAQAIRTAENYLVKRGWGFNASEIGNKAKEILKALGK